MVLYDISRLLNSRHDSIIISSSELGNQLGVSQQTASRYLMELEKAGLIKRAGEGRGYRIRITGRGVRLLADMHSSLNGFIRGAPAAVEGEVVTGMGEGAYYVREYADKLEKALGFRPFFGTLNLRVEEFFIDAGKYAAGEISEFMKGNRVFGGIQYIPVKIHGETWSHSCFLVIPRRTHHKNELEIISRFNLKDKFHITDGNRIRVEI